MTGATVEDLLLAFGRELEAAGDAQVGGSFTGSAEADALVRGDPNAFLIGLLFTQGVPAERAWAGPYQLAQRLDGWNLDLLASRPDLVREALQRPPMLHRFKDTLPRWISSAARRLIDEYGSDASRIWQEGTSVADVIDRLMRFEGIGRKKAVMGAELLVRTFGVPLGGRQASSVAYDVHVRRVFLRAGLAAEDSLAAVEAAARAICPESPGTLDLAAWLIGRQWCRPRRPLCDVCRLSEACPRRTWIEVEGVGVRR